MPAGATHLPAKAPLSRGLEETTHMKLDMSLPALLMKVQIQLLHLAVPRVMKPAKDVVKGLFSQAHLGGQLGDGRAFP
jgi:hypothetical protein